MRVSLGELGRAVWYEMSLGHGAAALCLRCSACSSSDLSLLFPASRHLWQIWRAPPVPSPCCQGALMDLGQIKNFWKPTWLADCWCQQVATALCSPGSLQRWQPHWVPWSKGLLLPNPRCPVTARPFPVWVVHPFVPVKRCSKPGAQSCSLRHLPSKGGSSRVGGGLCLRLCPGTLSFPAV